MQGIYLHVIIASTVFLDRMLHRIQLQYPNNKNFFLDVNPVYRRN